MPMPFLPMRVPLCGRVVLWLLLMAVAAGAAGCGLLNRGLCTAKGTADDERVQACTLVLQSATTPTESAIARYYRGYAYFDKGDTVDAVADLDIVLATHPGWEGARLYRGLSYDRMGNHHAAIADFTKAIHEHPNDWRPLADRGFGYAKSGRDDLAVADYSAALRIDPQPSDVRWERGRLLFDMGRFAQASVDLDDVEVSNHPYPALWAYLAHERAGSAAGAPMAFPPSLSPGSKWPAPVASLFRGTLTPARVYAAASDANQRCEAYFYIGEWQILKSDVRSARKNLQKAASLCPKDYVEYDGALAELKRLGGSAVGG